jgi:lysophospholipase L1-like esterase
LNASWVNGFHGFWQWMLGLTDVDSHNQRITGIWGRGGRTNYINAGGGSGIADFVAQAKGAVAQKASYVTVMLGNNDICQWNVWEIPSDQTFEAAFRAGLQKLRDGLPAGATVYVISLIDLTRLYDVAKHKKTTNGADCETIWSNDRFPCKTALDPQNSEADRALVRERNIAFNSILERVATEYQQYDPHHYYYFTDVIFNYPLVESDISDIDCFHPSAAGQRALSSVTWNAGPFGRF